MTITLLDGSNVESDELVFNNQTYHFSLNGSDVTNLVKPSDKPKIVPGFDTYTENQRLYNERRGGNGPVEDLSTSTTGIFTEQILTDPFSAPLAALDKGVNQFLSSKGIQVVAGVAVVLLVLFIVVDKKV